MADKVKKTETTAKPRKTATRKKADIAPVATMPSREEIEKLARDSRTDTRSRTGFAPSRNCARRPPERAVPSRGLAAS